VRKGDAEAHAGGEGGAQSDARRECFGRFEEQVRARAGTKIAQGWPKL
jgi:hypothetical protein